MQTSTLAPAASTDTMRYLAAFENASTRAMVSDFDIHIVCDADGSYWCADEGDYGFDLGSFIDRIVHTVPGRSSGLY
jgi:hypothetical protein